MVLRYGQGVPVGIGQACIGVNRGRTIAAVQAGKAGIIAGSVRTGVIDVGADAQPFGELKLVGRAEGVAVIAVPHQIRAVIIEAAGDDIVVVLAAAGGRYTVELLQTGLLKIFFKVAADVLAGKGGDLRIGIGLADLPVLRLGEEVDNW